ncbi:MAG: type II toxin-antitoxin system death-on-curing family toxin [Puniceicoccaceae bacterium]|nr:MAG: type II toxin-antitoxin system death-on-curing family toxin [Puniceicoccaceae bacterium]
MEDFAHPTLDAVLAIHDEVLAADSGSDGVRDKGLLESAIAAPQASIFGEPVFKDGIEIAAAYLFYLCQNHPFVDGNKRVALGTCLVFLSEDGLLCSEHLDVDAWETFTLGIASCKYDREGATVRLRELLDGSK